MIYTTKELLKLGETEYSIRNRVKSHTLYLVERGLYSTESDEIARTEAYISKKYPFAIFTGLSAFFIYGLTDYIPNNFDLATEQHSFPIRRKDVKQSYQDKAFFQIGVVSKQLDEGVIKIYDLERLLIELFRLREKYPPEIYYEVLTSFRKIKNSIDFYKLNIYAKNFSNGANLLLRIKEAL